jgi:uncharacterized membrane protein
MMSGKDQASVLISEVSDIEETRNIHWKRNLAAGAPLRWLSLGWKDLWIKPIPSLLYGLLVCVASIAFIGYMFSTGRDYFLFPALSGFLIVGPIIASGLYLKSRNLELGEPFSFSTMVSVRPKAGAQVFFTGMLLVMLILLWMRAAVLVYALFFGLQPFPGLDQIATMLLTTPTGWAMLFVGGFVGSLFAGFAFAISVFSIPMLLDRQIDAFTAMGISTTMVWNNLRVTITWGAIVLAMFLACLATGLLGLIVIFPWLGHATWHAYREMR